MFANRDLMTENPTFSMIDGGAEYHTDDGKQIVGLVIHVLYQVCSCFEMYQKGRHPGGFFISK